MYFPAKLKGYTTSKRCRASHLLAVPSKNAGLALGLYVTRQNTREVRPVSVDTLQLMLNNFFMKTNEASKLFEALAADIRLDIFRLLVKNAPEGLVAGDIAQLLDIPPTNLSFHLKTVVHSGLVSVEREGRFQRYKANLPLMLDVIAYLTSECCWGHPEKCQNYRAQSNVPLHLLPKRLQED